MLPYGGGCTGACGLELGHGGIQIGSVELGQGCRGGDAGVSGGSAFCGQTITDNHNLVSRLMQCCLSHSNIFLQFYS